MCTIDPTNYHLSLNSISNKKDSTNTITNNQIIIGVHHHVEIDDIYHFQNTKAFKTDFEKEKLLLLFKSGDNIFYTSRMDCSEGSMDIKVQRCMDVLRYIYNKSFKNICSGDQQNKNYFFGKNYVNNKMVSDYVYDIDENRITKSHTGYITPSLLESINNNNMEFMNINLDKYINGIFEIISIIKNHQSSRKPCIFGIGNSNEFSTIISIPHDGNHYPLLSSANYNIKRIISSHVQLYNENYTDKIKFISFGISLFSLDINNIIIKFIIYHYNFLINRLSNDKDYGLNTFLNDMVFIIKYSNNSLVFKKNIKQTVAYGSSNVTSTTTTTTDKLLIVTLDEIGFKSYYFSNEHIWDKLHQKILDEKDGATQGGLRKKSLTCDYFISSSFVADASGTRVGGFTAASNVIVVAGVNKIAQINHGNVFGPKNTTILIKKALGY
ncbi:hypothetical protein ACTFIY_004333 [Dictyostelium cf. discoideum]